MARVSAPVLFGADRSSSFPGVDVDELVDGCLIDRIEEREAQASLGQLLF